MNDRKANIINAAINDTICELNLDERIARSLASWMKITVEDAIDDYLTRLIEETIDLDEVYELLEEKLREVVEDTLL